MTSIRIHGVRVCGKTGPQGLPCRLLDGHSGLCELRAWKLEALPDYGDHMSMEEFVECVRSGGFIDDDGFAHYATETHLIQGPTVCPSEILQGNYHRSATHVVWYNR